MSYGAIELLVLSNNDAMLRLCSNTTSFICQIYEYSLIVLSEILAGWFLLGS